MENPGNRVMYYLLDGPDRAFVSEELMLIPEDTELPSDYVDGTSKAFKTFKDKIMGLYNSVTGNKRAPTWWRTARWRSNQ